jgi:oligoendopeptidase F
VYEISGVSLVDMRVWRWLYAHPEATPAQLREATLQTAREVWNEYYAPVFGLRDQEILAIYSHTVTNPLYLPDYAIGHIISFQVGAKLKGPAFGTELERMARQGLVTPDAWMRGAVGGPISSEALLAAAREALGKIR